MQFVQHSSGKTSKVIDMDKDTNAMVVSLGVWGHIIYFTQLIVSFHLTRTVHLLYLRCFTNLSCSSLFACLKWCACLICFTQFREHSFFRRGVGPEEFRGGS